MGRVLLVIDVQNDYFSGPMKVTYPSGSFSNILAVMDAASAKGAPVAVIRHNLPAEAPVFAVGSAGWELHPEVEKRPRDVLIDKTLPGSFTGTGLEQFLKDRGADTVTVAGYMTQMCCDTTSRQAAHLGFGVEFLSDATGTLDVTNSAGSVTAEELHRAILVTQAMRFARVMTTREWLDSL